MGKEKLAEELKMTSERLKKHGILHIDGTVKNDHSFFLKTANAALDAMEKFKLFQKKLVSNSKKSKNNEIKEETKC